MNKLQDNRTKTKQSQEGEILPPQARTQTKAMKWISTPQGN
jgi:hypothetical protein